MFYTSEALKVFQDTFYLSLIWIPSGIQIWRFPKSASPFQKKLNYFWEIAKKKFNKNKKVELKEKKFELKEIP